VAGGDQVIANLKEYTSRKVAGLLALGDSIGKGTLEAQAKLNAPWTDRTGNARQGLHGGAVLEGTDFVIYIAHTMTYGVYLELCNAGNFAILMPTLENNLEYIKKVISDYWGS
jgi:hypothetical protein